MSEVLVDVETQAKLLEAVSRAADRVRDAQEFLEQQVRIAHKYGGHSLRTIASHADVSHTTVGKIVQEESERIEQGGDGPAMSGSASSLRKVIDRYRGLGLAGKTEYSDADFEAPSWVVKDVDLSIGFEHAVQRIMDNVAGTKPLFPTGAVIYNAGASNPYHSPEEPLFSGWQVAAFSVNESDEPEFEPLSDWERDLRRLS